MPHWTPITINIGPIQVKRWVLQCHGFQINYVEPPQGKDPETGQWIPLDAPGVKIDGPETSLVRKGKTYILMGDWRKDYERRLRIVAGKLTAWKSCKMWYDSFPEHHSPFSN